MLNSDRCVNKEGPHFRSTATSGAPPPPEHRHHRHPALLDGGAFYCPKGRGLSTYNIKRKTTIVR